MGVKMTGYNNSIDRLIEKAREDLNWSTDDELTRQVVKGLLRKHMWEAYEKGKGEKEG